MVFAIFLALAGLTILSAQEKSLESTMLIRVEKAAVRAEPSFVSPALSFAAYKTPVAIIRIENDWIFGFVRGLNRPGYIHMSALSPVKVSLNPDEVSDPPPLQETEIVLAGKAFHLVLNCRSENQVLSTSKQWMQWKRIAILMRNAWHLSMA